MDKCLRGILAGFLSSLLLIGFWGGVLGCGVLAQVPRKLPKYVAEEPLFPVRPSPTKQELAPEEGLGLLMSPEPVLPHAVSPPPIDLHKTKKFAPSKELFSVQLDKSWPMPERKALTETGRLAPQQVTQYLTVNPSGVCSITVYTFPPSAAGPSDAPTPEILLLWASRMTQIKGQILHQGRFWQSGLPGASLLFYNSAMRIYGRFQFLLNSVSHSPPQVYQYGCVATEREVLYSEAFTPLFQTFQVSF